ncbi:MAG TPA: hypothetical protein PLM79_10500 [Syntrophobacteraceae bacterium]|nr:hypothetical protein [Syntrophobacteraceae bacterium]
MKRAFLVPLILAFALTLVSVSFAEESGRLDLKVGDEVYVCGCGKGCPCDTIAMKPGKCVCKRKLVKAKVVKVEEGKATMLVGKKETVFKTIGKYACACGPGCDCGTISQLPGKCACGKAMKKVSDVKKKST